MKLLCSLTRSQFWSATVPSKLSTQARRCLHCHLQAQSPPHNVRNQPAAFHREATKTFHGSAALCLDPPCGACTRARPSPLRELGDVAPTAPKQAPPLCTARSPLKHTANAHRDSNQSVTISHEDSPTHVPLCPLPWRVQMCNKKKKSKSGTTPYVQSLPAVMTRVRAAQESRSGYKRTVSDFSRYRTGRTGSSFARIINLFKFNQKELIFILLGKTTSINTCFSP
jgi:hypothetical protein